MPVDGLHRSLRLTLSRGVSTQAGKALSISRALDLSHWEARFATFAARRGSGVRSKLLRPAIELKPSTPRRSRPS
jgi:hypothetical protein